jgi:uncharacterized low-complexity protein
VQIHLQQNRADLATKEAQRARKWAQDSLLVNIAESWVGMREVSTSHTHLINNPTNKHLPGRRKIPIRVLRLRRARANLAIPIPALARRTSRLGTAPRPPSRSRSRAATGIRDCAEQRGYDCESGRAKYAAGQDQRDRGVEGEVGQCGWRAQGAEGLEGEEGRV